MYSIPFDNYSMIWLMNPTHLAEFFEFSNDRPTLDTIGLCLKYLIAWNGIKSETNFNQVCIGSI